MIVCLNLLFFNGKYFNLSFSFRSNLSFKTPEICYRKASCKEIKRFLTKVLLAHWTCLWRGAVTLRTFNRVA